MDDITLDDVPDALVEAVLRKLPRVYEIAESDIREKETWLTIEQRPSGAWDLDIGTTLDHERVTPSD